MRLSIAFASLLLAACSSSSSAPPSTATPGLIFHYPAADQIDVPLGARITVAFTTEVEASALSTCDGFCVQGPDGTVAGAASVGAEGRSVSLEGAALEPGVTYRVIVGQALSPAAENLASGPLFSFTTRAIRPRAAPPALIAVNGQPPEGDASARFFEASTIRLVFSEPLDPRPIALAPGAVELVDTGSGASIPATVIASGIHLSIDPIDDLVAGQTIEVRLGDRLLDSGGRPLAPLAIQLTPTRSVAASGPVVSTLRTRLEGDPGPTENRSGAPTNLIVMDKPLIGREELRLGASSIAAELGDPTALGGPIAFTIRRGQRLSAGSIDVRLGGEIPAGLSSGELSIEFLTDAGGLLFRNPYQDADQPPDAGAPLYVDFTFDVAISSADPIGNAVLAQTILGVRASGTAVATDGVLAIETVASMDLGLLGVTDAPTNLVLELITDQGEEVLPDRSAPQRVSTYPAAASDDFAVGNALEIAFSEPVDINSIARGGLRLEDGAGLEVAASFELHGSVVVLRPLTRLSYATDYKIVIGEITDVAGNPIASEIISFETPALPDTDIPITTLAVHPGVPCALTDGDATSPGRCEGGDEGDDRLAPFTLAANANIEAIFSQPLDPSSVSLGAACGSGSVRVEALDSSGACVGVVAGTFISRERSLVFVSDQPWEIGARYRLSLIAGGNQGCGDGELCGMSGEAANFAVLDGHEDNDAGGEDLIINFVGAPADTATFVFSDANPSSDVNGSGFIDGGEILRDANRAAMRIKAVEGDVDEASFDMDDCLPETPEVEGCMYLLGSMPVTMGELERDCLLPSGETVASCIPVLALPQVMLATSMAMDADVGISIGTDTGTTVMRVREREGGVRGFIINDGGSPVMVINLDLYMDAPDMSITLSDHDLHSKPVSMSLRGPVSFLPDGRIVINLRNTAAIEVRVAVDGPVGIDGTIVLEVPTGEMKLQLLSRPARGVER